MVGFSVAVVLSLAGVDWVEDEELDSGATTAFIGGSSAFFGASSELLEDLRRIKQIILMKRKYFVIT